MGSTKGTPKDWVDKLLRVGHANWVPPIPRLVPVSYSDLITKDQWAEQYRLLLDHHQLEMDVLNAVIRELVERLEKSK